MADVFISFIHEEEQVAKAVQAMLLAKLQRKHEVFVSADTWQMRAGEIWLDRIKEELAQARVLVSLLSPISIARPWVNFEAGAAWLAGKPIIPVCLGGLQKGGLPKPYSNFQALDLRQDYYYLVRSVDEWVTEGNPFGPIPFGSEDETVVGLFTELDRLADEYAQKDIVALSSRIGIGYDIHRLVEGRKLLLGGVEIPFAKGLLGHSDSDVLTHAICDALLGAAALGDIGTHFPDTDPRWAGASSLDLLAQVVERLADQGFRVTNVDATVMAEQPMLRPYIDSMRERLAGVLGIRANRVTVKAKTGEGLESIGRNEAMSAQAVALIHRRDAEHAEEAQR